MLKVVQNIVLNEVWLTQRIVQKTRKGGESVDSIVRYSFSYSLPSGKHVSSAVTPGHWIPSTQSKSIIQVA